MAKAMSKRATIRRQYYGEWVTVGAVLSNYEHDAGEKPNSVVWIGAWASGPLTAFIADDVAHPYLEGFLAARLLEGDVSKATTDYYQRCGYISTILKPGIHGPESTVAQYMVRLDCFPIVNRQFQKKGQAGLYLSIQEIDPTPEDPDPASDSKAKDTDATAPEHRGPSRAHAAVADFKLHFGLDETDLELLLDVDLPFWTDKEFDNMRRLYDALATEDNTGLTHVVEGLRNGTIKPHAYIQTKE